jgi:hypothetical protein
MPPLKNPHAVALGRLGGKSRQAVLTEQEITNIARLGGKARAKALSASERREIASRAGKARLKMSKAERSRIARLAAKARWGKRK